MYTLSKQYPEPVDLFQAISRSGIEHLEINPERIVLLFTDEVVLIQVIEGTLTAAEEIEAQFWETPRSTTTDWEALAKRLEIQLDEAINSESR
jgi:hypothetical protein